MFRVVELKPEHLLWYNYNNYTKAHALVLALQP